ncbi:Phosphatidylinositol transfer protein (PITP) [Knufia obscura]|uniref:Phosphatidylinositol transfer protein (PITP) n=2 Tax=Knufia TaxID=430999 RepID=A0AAN8ESL0_9EURO|nr:Phosphatidylinositol transfer protein (PITP) [Knufia obscura]KAK5951283.1 Phosphatidylinositol transfer protein (PITP) [Knufia fluminis]
MDRKDSGDDFKTPPQAAADVPATAAGIENLSLNQHSQLDGTSASKTTIASGTNQAVKRVETYTSDLNLPISSTDATVVNTPLAKPLDNVKPVTRPPPTADQLTKYDTLLAKVLKWTEIPESSAKGAKQSPIREYERMFLTRECLFRYLRATTWKVDQAETRLLNTLVWRREYGTDSRTSEYISIENETGKQVILGWDINGRPVQYLRPSKQNTERSDRQIEHLVYMLERTIDLMPPGQETLALLINFAETKAGQGATLQQGKQTLNILQNHYPERLGRALVGNVPWVIWGFFKMITPFIDPVTKEKIKFNEDFGLHVPREQLMKEAKGSVNFQYDHATYWPALNKLCELKRNAFRERWEAAGKRIGEYEMYLRGGEQKPLIEVEKE